MIKQLEEAEALGGMRNPARSLERLPEAVQLGELVSELLVESVAKLPGLKRTAEDIFNGVENVRPFPEAELAKVRKVVAYLLKPSAMPEPSDGVASTPLCAENIMGWGEHSDDPDASTLARWLVQGAPLGFQEEIERTGIFPPTTGTPSDAPTEAELFRDSENWSNWPSADEEEAEVHKLVRDAESKGFCKVFEARSDVRELLGSEPILNKLGVVVKHKEGVKKARIIWDLKESLVNKACDPAERVILPRLLDVVTSCIKMMQDGLQPTLAVADIRDAFHNIPAGRDRKFTVAAANMENGVQHFIAYMVLVFGSKSSPTIWGRFAALLGRSLAAVCKETHTQIYVDDPIFVVPSAKGFDKVECLTRAFLWTEVLGYPLKLSKAHAGDSIDWIGARINLDNVNHEVTVTIPSEKISSLVESVEEFLGSPVIGTRKLRSFAGSLSFVAGLVPMLRPFLAPLWAVLSSETTDDGSSELLPRKRGRTTGKLVHTKRIDSSLRWIMALLKGEENYNLRRTFLAFPPQEAFELVTDASPWGLGGVLLQDGIPVRWYASKLQPKLLNKFKAATGDPAFNTLWEALALLVACRIWLPKCKVQRLSVRVKSDNVGALRMLLNLSSKAANINVVARELALDLARGNYSLGELEHIPGVTNVMPDALSRLWAPTASELPALGNAVQDRVPDFGSSFWRVSE